MVLTETYPIEVNIIMRMFTYVYYDKEEDPEKDVTYVGEEVIEIADQSHRMCTEKIVVT